MMRDTRYTMHDVRCSVMAIPVQSSSTGTYFQGVIAFKASGSFVPERLNAKLVRTPCRYDEQYAATSGSRIANCQL
jgi:hypothetical protein